MERIKELEATIERLEGNLTASDNLIEVLRQDLDDAEKEQRAIFFRGMGIGAGATGVTVLIIWLVSAFAP
ncbi:MAG: hypothetical protein LC687_03310 [Actinobacteria bacterium]|nr:hypothetical protein [Actinomycetota bacterium]